MPQRVGYYWNAALQQRQTGFNCPEKPERIQVLQPAGVFAQAGVVGNHCQFTAREAEILATAHDPEYIAHVRESHQRGVRFLDAGETKVTEDLYAQALLSASAGVTALDAIAAGELTAAFCAVRPPGHHANRVRGMGFCVFNNAAVAAGYARARRGYQKILMVDWDVHPGNGSQEIFWEDPGVFNLSFHQTGLFEAAGSPELRGRGAGEGFNRNEPLPPSVGREGYLARFETVVREVAASYQPDLLIISAGFDAHRNDPASAMKLEAGDFERMTTLVLECTAPHTSGHTVSLLEGGYELGSLRNSVAAHYRALCAFFA